MRNDKSNVGYNSSVCGISTRGKYRRRAAAIQVVSQSQEPVLEFKRWCERFDLRLLTSTVAHGLMCALFWSNVVRHDVNNLIFIVDKVFTTFYITVPNQGSPNPSCIAYKQHCAVYMSNRRYPATTAKTLGCIPNSQQFTWLILTVYLFIYVSMYVSTDLPSFLAKLAS